jgi:hypothetical protein
MGEIVIDPRFCGPPGVGNGGYVCGRLAAPIGDSAEVTLRRPVPLGRTLRLASDAGGARLLDGESLLVEARPGEPALVPPALPPRADADAASTRFIGFTDHGVRGCFVCGTSREAGDGLRIFAGPLGRDDIVAAPWRPDAELADAAGLVRPEFVWAALDCPGAFAFTTKRSIPLLLGRLTARLGARLRPGETATVLGWPIGRDGRKLFAGTAVFAASGALAGLARAVWFLPAGVDSLE